MSVTQGGPEFSFLYPSVYLHLCTEFWSPVTIPTEAIQDPDLRIAIEPGTQSINMSKT